MTEVTIRLRFDSITEQGALGAFIDRLLKHVEDDEALHETLFPALMDRIVVETSTCD